MAETTLIDQVRDWLIDQALGEPDMVEMFHGVCQRIAAIGIPIARARLMWPTLHPLFQAETVVWRRGRTIELEQFNHQDTNSDAWNRSPMHFMGESGIGLLRRRLVGPGKLLDFDVVKDLADEGYTDYLVIGTSFTQPGTLLDERRRGIFVTWASDRPGGFTDEDLTALQRLQRRFAVACKTVIQARIAKNITETYLGRQAGARVLNGLIRLGDGQETRAIVWYSDLRDSTHLAETMPSAVFLELLNAYFECAARPAITAGGEVLAFIGDAVLAIFPVGDDTDVPALAARVFAALQTSLALSDQVNRARQASGLEPIRYGLGLNLGTVMFGNIGVPERLAFSAIGPTVIEVARIEKLSKTTGDRALASRDIAALAPELWRSIGEHPLQGISHPTELFAFRGETGAALQ